MKGELKCAFCGRLPTPNATSADDMLIQNEPARNAAICGDCLSEAVVAIYDAGGELPKITQRLRDEFTVSTQFEQTMKEEIRVELRQRYQRELLAARDPQPFIGENKSKLVTVTMNDYMKTRIDALAREAGLSISGWVRRAIFIAFEMTKHTA
jgi:hypothetical protein